MLASKEKLLKNQLLNKQDYFPFPKVQDRPSWEQLPEELRNRLISLGEGYLDYQWPSIPAIRYMDFVRNGNRIKFEELYFQRRRALGTLVIAECIEGRGRFIDDLINGLWLICEESSWVLPAHNNNQKLPNIQEQNIDLFVAETGALLVWTYYLLKSSLDQETSLIGERIKHEVNRRVIEPYLTHNYGWAELSNNWNTWINSNCLTAFLLMEEDQEKRLAGVNKVIDNINVFLKGYPEDGGCDEGPNYWGRAAGSLFDTLEQLFLATDGQFDFYNQPLIKNIGRYIYHVNIADDYFVNFADGSAKVTIDAPVAYMYGKRIHDAKLATLGARAQLKQGIICIMQSEILSLFRVLLGIFNHQEMITMANQGQRQYMQDVWLDRVQVMVAREKPNFTSGFYLAAKGGHNHESHNHNDIGSFILFYDAEPIFIDVGVGEYTAKTFSADRYDIWTMQSSYHNLPTIGNAQQQAGIEYRASDIHYQAEPNFVEFSLDISTAYSTDAQIDFWRRGYILKRGRESGLIISDDFLLKKAQYITVSFMLTNKPDISRSGQVLLSRTSNVLLYYDPSLFQLTVEKIPIDDQRLTPVWGKELFRLLLKTNTAIVQKKWQFEVSKA